MKSLIEKGEIVHIGDGGVTPYGELVQVFAQKDKIKDGKELFARYYKGGEGYTPLETHEEIRRVGELLGYTNNDIAFCLGEKYNNLTSQTILNATDNLRRWARKEYMLNYNEQSPE